MTYTEFGPHLQLKNPEELKGYLEKNPQELADIVAAISVRESVLVDYDFFETPLESPRYSKFDIAQIAAMNMVQVKDSMKGDLEEWIEDDSEIGANYLLSVINHYLESGEIKLPLEITDESTA